MAAGPCPSPCDRAGAFGGQAIADSKGQQRRRCCLNLANPLNADGSATVSGFFGFAWFRWGSADSAEADDSGKSSRQLAREVWLPLLHPRARSLFENEDALLRTVMRLADGVGADEIRRVLAPGGNCVKWAGRHGVKRVGALHVYTELSQGSQLLQPTQLVVMLFGDDERYLQVLNNKNPRTAMTMSCRDTRCCCLHHVRATIPLPGPPPGLPSPVACFPPGR